MSLTARLGVVALALIQFSVCSLYAPVHRLLHHSVLIRQSIQPDEARPHCHSHCCAHHRPAAVTESSTPARQPEPSPGCPHDEGQCAWCAIAAQQADLARLFPADVIPPRCGLIPSDFSTPAAVRHATAFDSRGPPSV